MRVTTRSVVLDMSRVFEDFVTVSLADALRGRGGRVSAQHRTSLDVDGAVAIRPDVVWLSDEGLPLAVVDAKCKAERPSGFPEADLYQALAYAVALGLDRAHLVYARGNDAHASHVVRHAGVRLTAHAPDLAQPPVMLLDQVSALAPCVAAEGAVIAAAGV